MSRAGGGAHHEGPSLGGVLQQLVDLLRGGVAVDGEDAVREGRVEQRHAHGVTVQLPLELGVDECDGRGGPCMVPASPVRV